MTFKITRTSQYNFDKDKPPCKNAEIKQKEYEYETRIFDENRNQIKQTMIRTINYWEIEIDTLEELIELLKEVREDRNEVGLILFDGEIEIYDGYRE